MKSKKGIAFIVTGLLCIIAALALFVFNQAQSGHARTESENVVAVLSEQIRETASQHHGAVFPTDDPERPMPVLTVEDRSYVGILSIPALELELPVLSYFDESALQITPCLYSGSIYNNDMVIGAHNYDAHFGRLRSLVMGDEVTFTNTENNRWRFEVVDMETLAPEQNDVLIGKQYENDRELTLFTCNYTGSARLTVRCKEIQNDAVRP
ncbi:MAG: sortase [Ruminococcus sp.]|nr:sortase [Ruminococcus sp.]